MAAIPYQIGQKNAARAGSYMSLSDVWDFRFDFDPPVWQASTAYAGGFLIKPSASNGMHYRCSSGGISGASEPSWGTEIGTPTTDGTAEWEPVDGLLALDAGETIASAAFTATTGVTLGTSGDHAPVVTSSSATAWVTGFDAGFSSSEFQIVCTATTSLFRVYEIRLKVGVK